MPVDPGDAEACRVDLGNAEACRVVAPPFWGDYDKASLAATLSACAVSAAATCRARSSRRSLTPHSAFGIRSAVSCFSLSLAFEVCTWAVSC